ncbi:MAG TPA: basic amino acid ABC transporter substrate-binding protein [Aggregatilineales bacterium]|nr:basic amino acid ABC transporter substrate-binding protein [Aggregatilineales bacterium]
MNSRPRLSIMAVAVAGLAVLLSACGSPTPTPAPQPLPTNAPAAATAAVPAATVAATTAPTVAASATTAPSNTPAPSNTTAPTSTTAPTNTTAPTVAATVAAPAATTAATVAQVSTEAAPAAAAATTAATQAPAAPQQETPPATQPATLKQCATGGTITVGSDATYPPFESVNQTTGKIEGFDVDLLTAIGAKEGFTLDMHNALFDTIFTALSYGQYDVVISASTITYDREQTVNFSNPYFDAGQVIVLRKADIGKIKTPDDLAGKTVGVQAGTTGADAAHAIKNTKAVQEYKTAPEAFQALANGDLDAVVNDSVTSISIILNDPKLNEAVAGAPFTQEYYGIAVRKDCTDLLKKINDGLAAVISDGTYADIYGKYIGEPPDDPFKKGDAGVTGYVPTQAPPAPTAAAAAATMAATTAAPAATMAATQS